MPRETYFDPPFLKSKNGKFNETFTELTNKIACTSIKLLYLPRITNGGASPGLWSYSSTRVYISHFHTSFEFWWTSSNTEKQIFKSLINIVISRNEEKKKKNYSRKSKIERKEKILFEKGYIFSFKMSFQLRPSSVQHFYSS